MPELMRYDSAAMIPLRLEAQIRPLLYAEWPASDEDEVARPLIDPELHPQLHTFYFLRFQRLTPTFVDDGEFSPNN